MAQAYRVRARLTAGLGVAVFLATPAAAAGQSSDPPRASGTRMGPMHVEPLVDLSAGLDTNVLNEAEDAKRDYVIRFNPQARIAMGLSRLRMTATVSAPMHHFRLYNDQDSNGVRGEVRVDLSLNRLKPFVNEGFVRSSERTGPEIDARVAHAEQIFGAGTDVTLSRRFTLTASVERSISSFGADAIFDTVNLSQMLDRRGDTAGIALRYAVTSLTKLVMTADWVSERFDFQHERDSDSLRVLPGIEFDPAAFIHGKAIVGYRRFDITDARLDDFSGMVASVDLASTIRDMTVLAVSVSRDVAYSYDPIAPYYVINGVGASITQSIAERWRVTLQADRQRLNYEEVGFDRIAPSAPRIDQLYTLGGGLQFRIRRNLGVGVVMETSRRLSGMVRREYQGTRIFSSITYGS
jgi:hypothetical protein